MKLVKTITEVRTLVAEAKARDKRVGFVPTMGALHAGHISLVKDAVKDCDFVVVSIFVNPAQFAPGEDIDAYPKTLDDDLTKCRENGVDVVFAPLPEQMYPEKNLSWVEVEKLTLPLCGRSRPAHFKGVTTVCAKLFNIVQPDKAYFGQKDAQQAIVVKRMVDDLNMPLEIVICPTVREKSGLAMSSRNAYLSDDEKKQATLLYAALQECELLIAGGLRDSQNLIGEMRKLLAIGRDIKIDYISIVNADTLEEIGVIEGRVLVALAVKIGPARLIDNVLLDIKSA